jgi:hypothetical protein
MKVQLTRRHYGIHDLVKEHEAQLVFDDRHHWRRHQPHQHRKYEPLHESQSSIGPQSTWYRDDRRGGVEKQQG